MKLVSFLVSAASVTLLQAEPLTPEQSAELMAGVIKLQEAFDNGDVAALSRGTHPKIHALFGGKETFEKTTAQAMQSLKDQEIRVTENKYGTPSAIHRSGNDQVCFVPRTNVMHIGDKKIRGKGFLIAIRSGGEPWRFLDGAILQEKPELLHMLLPGLPKDISLPENRFEPVE